VAAPFWQDFSFLRKSSPVIDAPSRASDTVSVPM